MLTALLSLRKTPRRSPLPQLITRERPVSRSMASPADPARADLALLAVALQARPAGERGAMELAKALVAA